MGAADSTHMPTPPSQPAIRLIAHRLAIAAAPSPSSLPSLRSNAQRNSHKVVIERLRLHTLEAGGGDEQLAAARRAVPSGLDLMLLQAEGPAHLAFALSLVDQLLLPGAGRAWLAAGPGLGALVEAGVAAWPLLRLWGTRAQGVATIEEVRNVRLFEIRKV